MSRSGGRRLLKNDNSAPSLPLRQKRDSSTSSLKLIHSHTNSLNRTVSLKAALRDQEWARRARVHIAAELSSSINRSNGVIHSPPCEPPFTYKFYLAKGNNSQVLRKCFSARPWWTEHNEAFSSHLVWTQFLDVPYTQLIPILQLSPGLTVTPSCEQSIKCAELCVGNTLEGRQVDISALGLDLITKARSYTTFIAKGALQAKDLKLHNKLECHYQLSDKKSLYRNLRSYYQAQGQDVFANTPLTFHIQSTNDGTLQEFVAAHERLSESQRAIWIVKPGENSNRGAGISLSDSAGAIVEWIQRNCGDRTFIIQKYIDEPFLLSRRKFDIRCFVLVTSVNGVLQSYFYREGYLRTATKEYSSGLLHDKYIHLTNDAIQKQSIDYGKFENGNKLSYADLQKYLDVRGPRISFEREVLPRIRQVVVDTVKATYSKLNRRRRAQSFEVVAIQLFGYDFLLDRTLKPWLIEVNTNPCLEMSSPILARIIPALVENVLKIAVDPLFPAPSATLKKLSNSSAAEYLQENKFELVFHQAVEEGELFAQFSGERDNVTSV